MSGRGTADRDSPRTAPGGRLSGCCRQMPEGSYRSLVLHVRRREPGTRLAARCLRVRKSISSRSRGGSHAAGHGSPACCVREVIVYRTLRVRKSISSLAAEAAPTPPGMGTDLLCAGSYSLPDPKSTVERLLRDGLLRAWRASRRESHASKLSREGYFWIIKRAPPSATTIAPCM
jgi:hypothetical protein